MRTNDQIRDALSAPDVGSINVECCALESGSTLDPTPKRRFLAWYGRIAVSIREDEYASLRAAGCAETPWPTIVPD